MIMNAAGKTLRSLLDPSVLLILFLPWILASLFWFLVLFFVWGAWTSFLVDTQAFTWLMGTIGDNLFLDSLKVGVVILATLLIFGPLWYLTYLLIISIFLFPLLLPRIQRKSYPNLTQKKGGSTLGSLKTTLVASFIFVAGYMLTLPLWLFTPLAPAINILLTAYLNKKVFTYDVLQDYTTEQERLVMEQKNSNELWLTGILTALLTWVPVVNFLAPALTALVFIHVLLQKVSNHQNKA